MKKMIFMAAALAMSMGAYAQGGNTRMGGSDGDIQSIAERVTNIEKKNDAVMPSYLGATKSQITRIFLYEGRIISTIGAVVGILLGLLLCWLQQEFGFVHLGDGSGSFVVNAYPVSVHYWDVFWILVTVVAVGWGAAWIPVRGAVRKLTEKE